MNINDFQKMNYKNVKISEDARIAKQSVVIGDVTIGRDSCVLHYAVIRGDDAPVVIGEESNIQENCTIHVNHNMPVHIGNNVTVGHNAVLHGCVIGDRTLIGMGAVVLDGARIGRDCIIGAGSLVTKNTVIPDGSLVMGSPAKIKRNLTWEEKLRVRNETVDNRLQVLINGNELSVLGVSAGVPVILASVDGCVVRSMTSTSDKVTLILPSLKGVFVLKAGDRSVKIMF